MLAALRRFHRLAAPALAFAALAASGPGPARAADAATGRTPAAPGHAYAIHIAHEATAGTLRRVLDGARERLSEPRCQGILDDFRDGAGRPLRDRLEETGRSPEGYLDLIVFYDGRAQVRCHQKGVLAVTAIDSRVVHVCPEELAIRVHRNPAWAEATLIHEALHTLGLGENPPSSAEITERVIRQCEP